MPTVIARTEFVYRTKSRKLLLAWRAATTSPTYLYRVPGRFDRKFEIPGYPRVKRKGWMLRFAAAPSFATVPNFVGLDSTTAQAAVTAAGFANAPLTQAYSTTVPVGTVISQNPLAGATAALGTSVFLVVSVGPTPAATQVAPSAAQLPPMFVIPLQVGTPQRFSITLNGKPYQFTLRYRNVAQSGWVLDVTDDKGTNIITGIPLVTGANLLAQYAYLGFGGALWVQTQGNPDAVPTFANLGGDALFWWVPG